MTARNPVSIPVGGAIPDTTQLGGAPRDGDFARLLDAASQPAAHRLHRTLQNLPQVQGSRVPAGHSGMSAQNTAFGHGASVGQGGAQPLGTSDARADDATQLALQTGASTLAAGASVIKRWSDKPPRDRFISALFALAALWIGITIFGQLITQFDEHAGLLIMLAIGAFIFFSRRSQRRRTQT